jgi:protease II
MREVATRKGQSQEEALGFQEMGTLRCDGCGEQFLISHDPAFADKRVAEKQASWFLLPPQLGERIVVSYVRQFQTEVDIFDLSGLRLGQLPVDNWTTLRLGGGSEDTDELFYEQESFMKPIQVRSYSSKNGETRLWAERKLPFDQRDFGSAQVWFRAKDKTLIPMFLVGHRDVLESGSHPVIMTSYGAHGVSMTPQFSVFVAFLREGPGSGCFSRRAAASFHPLSSEFANNSAQRPG